MSVTSVVNGSSSCGRKPYPKLIKSLEGNIYYVFGRFDGVAVHLKGQPIASGHFYPSSRNVDWELSKYTDFDGSVTLKNA